uniref:Uncharacterized protein n=1 Tax=Anguilla anguilla TaxID=7936 RepID=A0A0E9Q765_ANGAN
MGVGLFLGSSYPWVLRVRARQLAWLAKVRIVALDTGAIAQSAKFSAPVEGEECSVALKSM